MNDSDFMKYVLHLAQQAKGHTSPNPMVGAVIVKNGKIIAEGFHAFCGGDHAEIAAFKKINFKAQGATLYVNLEPCFHVGRTPPCVDSVIKSGIKRIVIGMKDPNPFTNGKSIQKLKRNGIEVETGVLQEACEELNENFIKYITTKRPFVVAKSAQSLDGKIALHDGQSKWITSEKTRQFARQKRAEFDSIMVGVGTVLNDNPALEALGKKKIRKIIVDSRLRISPSARLFKNIVLGQCIIVTTKKASAQKISLLKKKRAEILIDPSGQKRVNLPWLFQELGKREVTSVLLEGGAELIGSALKEKLVDKMHVYIAPKILGEEALSSVTGFGVKSLNQALLLKNITLEALADDLFLEGYVKYPSIRL